jgi:biopolymer transport protein ExbD
MRFKSGSRLLQLEKGSSTIDIAPLIDIVFQMLIFFMLTSSFIFQPGIKINLPKAVTSEVLHEQNVVITVTGENLIYLDNKAVTSNELNRRLTSEIGPLKKPLLIKADRHASLGRVVEVWDMCRAAGISQVNIATNPKD